MSVRIVNVTSAVPGLPGAIGVPIVGRVPPAPLEPPCAADPPEPAAAPPVAPAPPLPVVALPPLPPVPELEEPDEPHPAAAIARTDQSRNEQDTGDLRKLGTKGQARHYTSILLSLGTRARSETPCGKSGVGQG